MKYKYSVFGDFNEVDLVEVEIQSKTLLHATPKENKEKIMTEGIKTGMPATKSIAQHRAIFLSIPSANPSTADLFRFYDGWCVISVDTGSIPNHKFYVDFFAQNEVDMREETNNHVMCLEDIPPKAIKAVFEVENQEPLLLKTVS